MLSATTNEAVVLSMVAADGRPDLYGQAKIYDVANALVATVEINYVTNGLYSVSYTPTTIGFYNVIYDFYLDDTRLDLAGYEKTGEVLEVSDSKTNITRLLGLSHHNSYIDNTVYNTDGKLTSARVRAYNSAVNAAAHTATGLLHQWTVAATFSGENMLTYQITRDV